MSLSSSPPPRDASLESDCAIRIRQSPRVHPFIPFLTPIDVWGVDSDLYIHVSKYTCIKINIYIDTYIYVYIFPIFLELIEL